MKYQARYEIHLNQTKNDHESQAAYDTIYEVGDISQTDSFYLWINELLQLEKHESYLDISCGRGQLVKLAQSQTAEVVGLDLSYIALASTNGLASRLGLTAGNSQALPYADNSFDVISNIGSLEHYTDMATAVREMARVVKPNGRLLILVPNAFSLLYNILAGFNDGRTMVDIQPIQRYAARHEWQDLLEDNGLTVVDTLRYEIENPRRLDDWIAYCKRPKKLVRLATKRFVPFNLSCCFLYYCRKA